MPFAPSTYVDGTVLTAAALEGDLSALRVYLHRGIASGDIATDWIEPRHVQSPVLDPWTNIQHGVTGHVGAQTSPPDVRLQFATKFLSGNGFQSADNVHQLPGTAFTLDVRRAARCLFHWWFELEAGNDNSTAGYQLAEADREVWVFPYVGNPSTAIGSHSHRAQETMNAKFNIGATYPIGLLQTVVQGGGYGAKQLTMMHEAPVGRVTAGLAAHSAIDRVGVLSWGVTIETYYL